MRVGRQHARRERCAARRSEHGEQRERERATHGLERKQPGALRLRRDFGAELLVVPVPAKASLSHADLGMAYDNFLPKLHEALGRKDVRAIDSWSLLRPLGDRAVLRTETHLSPATYEALAGAITARLRGP